MQGRQTWARLRRWRRPASRWALVVTPVVVVTVWLAFHHRPGWYRPVTLDEEGSQRARRESAALFDSIGDQLVLGRTFDITLQDRAVNEWLAALPTVWPQAGELWPPELHDPVVRFQADRLRLAARLERNGWRAVVALDVHPEVSKDGTSLTVELLAVRAGSLPVPRTVLRWMTAAMIPPRGDASRPAAGGDLAELLRGATKAPNRFVWPNGKRPFRVRSIHAASGELRLELEPLDNH